MPWHHKAAIVWWQGEAFQESPLVLWGERNTTQRKAGCWHWRTGGSFSCLYPLRAEAEPPPLAVLPPREALWAPSQRAACGISPRLGSPGAVRACGARLQVPPSALCCRKSSARLLLLRARSRPGAAAPGIGPKGLGLAPGVLTCSASPVRAAGHLEDASVGRGRDEKGLRVPSR